MQDKDNLAENGMASKLRLTYRRASERLPTMLRVEYSTGGDIFSGFSTDISEGGLFLQANQRLTPGTRLHIKIQLPGNLTAIRALGQVIWVHNGAGNHPRLPGAGISFQFIPEEHRKVLNQFLLQYR